MKEKKYPVYPTFPAFGFEEDRDNFSVEFDWEAFGCPSDIHVKIGDKSVKIPLPDDFPEKALKSEKKNLEVYNQPQSFTGTSTPYKTSRNARLSFTAVNVSVPFEDNAGDVTFLDGAPDRDDNRLPVYDLDGKIAVWIVKQKRSEPEQQIAKGSYCRAE